MTVFAKYASRDTEYVGSSPSSPSVATIKCSATNNLRLICTALLCTITLVLCMLLPQTAHAASGTVYSCKVIPTYQHPVTGTIEDSGGASSQATGQAMVESSVGGKGMLEITDSGKFYLTIRMSLVDYTRDHEFQVQEWGGDSWETPKMGVTATGSDSNGTTNDVCIQVPSQKCIVRVSMFVESMGRAVVFFCYAKGFEEGIPKGFTATRVTKASDGGAAAAASSQDQAESGDAASRPEQGTAPEAATENGAAAPAGGNTSADGDAPVASDASELTGGAVSSAQGLSLSTADDVAAASGANGSSDANGTDAVSSSTVTYSLLDQVLVNIASIVGAGVVLLLVAAAIVYFFRRNWNRWGGSDPDDYSEEYGDE